MWCRLGEVGVVVTELIAPQGLQRHTRLRLQNFVGLLMVEAEFVSGDQCFGVITSFPGGIVGSGSKVGSKYSFLSASTNHAYCPTLKGLVDSRLSGEVGSVVEIVIDGLTEKAIKNALRVGIMTACNYWGEARALCRISAGNYGGNLGKYHFYLEELLADCD